MNENPYKAPGRIESPGPNASKPLLVGNLAPLAALLVMATVVGFAAVMTGFWFFGYLR